jgi:hypothetical protein
MEREIPPCKEGDLFAYLHKAADSDLSVRTALSTIVDMLLSSIAKKSDAKLTQLRIVNRGRKLLTINDSSINQAAIQLIARLLLSPAVSSGHFRSMMKPFGPTYRIVGIQFVIPTAVHSEGGVPQQWWHTDTDALQKMIVLAVSVDAGAPLGTLFATESVGPAIKDGRYSVHMDNVRCARSVFFAFDGGTVHAGPAASVHDATATPHLRNRVFILLCAGNTDNNSISAMRLDNGLHDYTDFGPISIDGWRDAS